MGAQLHLISSHPACKASANRQLDVVFVHGLGGDPFGTWRHGEDESTSWPHWLAQEYGEQIGVWSFGYPASKFQGSRMKESLKKLMRRPYDEDAGYSMPLPDRAGNALHIMVREGIGQRPCIFIAHSLGGLLVKYVLNLAYEEDKGSDEHALITNCKALLFLATPHQGSMLASLVSNFRVSFPSMTIDELRENDSHLRRLFQWYRKYAPQYHIDTRSFYENRATKGVIVVKPDSADPGTGKNPICHDSNHLAISCPKAKNDPVVIEAKLLINDHLPLNPKIIQSVLSNGSTPYPFPDADYHLKVSAEENHKTTKNSSFSKNLNTSSHQLDMRNCNLTKLNKLLRLRQWKAADQETARLLLQFSDTESQDRLNIETLEAIPCSILTEIDQSWLKYSIHKFGFSIQSTIWQQEFGGIIDSEIDRYLALANRFGWREANGWKDYNDLTFDLGRACRGHLPCFFLSSLCDRYDPFLMSFVIKFTNCIS
jgi:hypothetical protein